MLVDKYFKILTDYFGEDYKFVSEANFSRKSRLKIRIKYADPVIRRSMLQTLLIDLEKLNWEEQETSIRQKCGVKAHYVGSEYGYNEPSASSISRFLRKTALYADTIVLEEQILDELLTWRGFNDRIVMNFIIDYALQYLSLQENRLFDRDSDSEICELAPAFSWIAKKTCTQRKSLGPYLRKHH
jgi:hypothetical protein